MNKVMLIGRLVADPEVRIAGETKVVKYRLAVDRKYKKDGEQTADFISCVTFGKSAEFVEKYLRKGLKIAVAGKIQMGSYTKEDGTKVYTTDVVAEEHEFCEKAEKKEEAEPKKDEFVEIADGDLDDLPF